MNTAPNPAIGNWPVQAIFVDGPFGQALNFSPTDQPITTLPSFVHHMTLADLDLVYTDWTLNEYGNFGSQANYLLQNNPAAVAIAGTDITMDNCRIAHTGADAVRILGQRVMVRGTEITDVGASPIVLGSPLSLDHNYKFVASLAADNRVEDNILHAFGRVFREGPGITQFIGYGNLYAHNRVLNGPYSGMSIGWGAPAAWGLFAGNNIVEFNEIFDVMRTLNDGAGLYMMGAQPGTMVRNNVIHDILATNEHLQDIVPLGTFIWGIYLDNAVQSVLIRDNLICRTAWGAIMLNTFAEGTRDNEVTNNILVDGQAYQLWLNSASEDSFERNIVYTTVDTPLFSTNAADAVGLSDYNLFYSTPSPDLGDEWLQWLSYGFDAHSLVADPGFANYSEDEFTVGADSPAVTQLGFVMPDLSTVGPRGRYQGGTTSTTTSTTTTTTTLAVTTTSTTAGATTTITIPGNAGLTLAIAKKWNLLASAIGFPPATAFGDSLTFASVWTWVNSGSGGGTWAVYLPGEVAPGSYATAKGFQTLTTIGAGEGFWLNSLKEGQQVTISGIQEAGPVSLQPGWNLLGTRGQGMLVVADLGPVVSVWKWTMVGSGKNWAVALPLMADQGKAYAASKGFGKLDAIAPGEGFWVNAGE